LKNLDKKNFQIPNDADIYNHGVNYNNFGQGILSRAESAA
jgi:hypothetical protein